MASNACSGSAKTDEVAACAQKVEQPKKQSQDPSSYSPPCCTFTENHLPPHLQQLQYGQFDETFFSHFPAAAMHMLAWQWPSNLGFAAAPCTISKEIISDAPGQCSNQGNNVNPIFEYVNQLGDFYKQLPRHSKQAPQHQYLCQYPHQFMPMSQGSEGHSMHSQKITYFKDEESKLAGLQHSDAPHPMNRSQALSTHSVPMDYLPGASSFQPRVAHNLAGQPSCGESGFRALNPGLLSKNINARLHQGDGEENFTRETEKGHSGPEQTQFKYPPPHYSASPSQRLFHAPSPLNPQDNAHCVDERRQYHYHRAACNPLMPTMSCLDTDGYGAAQWNGLQPVAGLWSQVGASSVYPPRCLPHVPSPIPTPAISTPFPVSFASSTLPDLFSSLRDSRSSTSLPSSSSPFQLSAQSAFSYMTSYDSPFLRPIHNTKSTGCHMQFMSPGFAATNQHAISFPGSQLGQSVSSDESTRRDERSDNDPKCHPSDTRISTPTPAVAGSRHEPSESCQGSNSGMNSSLVEDIASANGTFQRASLLGLCPCYPTAKSNPLSHPSFLPADSPENVSKDPQDCGMERHENLRTPDSATRGPSESAGVVNSSHQGGRYGCGRNSPPEFCNLLGQDQHVLMRRNSQYAIARDPLKMQVGALALCDHQALDFPNATAPYVQPTSIDEVHIVQMGRTSSTQRQPGVKGQWGAAEDRVLSKLVKRYGSRRWSLISTFMANRSGKQCRERWVNHLQPDIRKESWTTEEEELLVRAHSTFGNRWSAIAKMLPGRTDNSIKNHWHAALRKKDRHGQLRPSLLREYIQKKTAASDLSTKALATIPPPVQTVPEVNMTDACLTDSTNDKKRCRPEHRS